MACYVLRAVPALLHTQKKNAVMPYRGFTLVELSIVIVLIGLLTGGILKGQQVLVNGRLTSTMAQVQAIAAAKEAFHGTYGYLPGDLPQADVKVRGCTQTCASTATTQIGNGSVGAPAWAMYLPQVMTPLAANTPISDASGEVILFWYELGTGGFLAGVTDEGISGGAELTCGGAFPRTSVGGCFIVGQASSIYTAAGGLSGRRPITAFTLQGTVVALSPTSTAVLADPAIAAAKGQPDLPLLLTPHMAAVIDRKSDDGTPGSGNIQAYGNPATCYLLSGGIGTYDEKTSEKDCGLIFGI